jgi:hypothetical protein
MKLPNKERLDIPVIALLAANAIPLFGVLFLDWDAFFIVILYWSENLAIGFYNILKMAFAAVPHPKEHLYKLSHIPGFAIHYGGFTAGHGLFILVIFKNYMWGETGEKNWPCSFFVQIFLDPIKEIYSIIPSQMKIAILALFISHGVSFVYNYLLKGEYKTAKLKHLEGAPYGRVIVMHIAILAGGFFTMILGSPAALLVILVILKTLVDINLHLLSHKKAQSNKSIVN